MWSLAGFVFACNAMHVLGHGFLEEPPARNSMWRKNYPMEPNYNDMGLNCGGFDYQWNKHGGACGLCGDPVDGPRHHEAGGKHAAVDRPIPRCYDADEDSIDVVARITAYHKGWMEFRLCVNNNLSKDPGQDCVDNGHLLKITGTDLTRYDINGNKQLLYEFQLDLPEGVLCSQCILHWKYNAGNNWGCETDANGVQKCGEGYGRQEQFINCADISIKENCDGQTTPDTKVTVSTPSLTPYTATTRGPPASTTTSAKKTCGQGYQSSNPGATCEAVGEWAAVDGMAEWCTRSCFDEAGPLCPATQCSCDTDK